MSKEVIKPEEKLVSRSYGYRHVVQIKLSFIAERIR